MEEKKMHIELWRESGLSKSEYAQQIGIDRNQFYRWLLQMHRNDVKANEFVRVSVVRQKRL
jgi:transposase-like protein